MKQPNITSYLMTGAGVGNIPQFLASQERTTPVALKDAGILSSRSSNRCCRLANDRIVMERAYHFETWVEPVRHFFAEGQNSVAVFALQRSEGKPLPRWPHACFPQSMPDPVASRIEHYMDLLSSRQKLVASNIANIDTPGYKTKDFDFQFEFMSLARGASPNVSDAQGLVVKSDGNNVNLDREARLLSENALRFNFAANLLRSQSQLIRTAIQESK